MREILFRGKRKDNGEWVYGSLVKDGKPDMREFYIMTIPTLDEKFCVQHEVDPETVGQFTGLTDEYGTKIFEGDIVSFVHDESYNRKEKKKRNYEVQFVNLFSQYGLRLKNKRIHFPFKQSTASMYDVKVIGNIHDNPELLEVQHG